MSTFDFPRTEAELLAVRELGLAKARELAGTEAVMDAEVAEDIDLEGWPLYRITLLVDPELIEQKLGHLGLGRFITGLSLGIGDELFTRRDPYRVRVRPLDRTDWPKRNDKGPMVAR